MLFGLCLRKALDVERSRRASVAEATDSSPGPRICRNNLRVLWIVSAGSACVALSLLIAASFLFRPVGWEDGDRQIDGVQRLLFIAAALAALVALVSLWGAFGELRDLYRANDQPSQSDQPG